MTFRFQSTRGRHTIVATAALAMSVGLALTGCTHAPANTSSGATGGSSSATAIAGRPTPVANTKKKAIKIAMIGFSNNPYWVSVKAGADAANKVLAKYDASVSWIVAGNTIDVPTVNSALQSAQVQGYNGAGFFIAGEGNCATIKSLTGKGMAIGAYNTQFPCVESSGGVIDYAQNQIAAGKLAAQEMIKATGGKAGKVGIIVSSFTAPGSEQRRQGFVDGLKGSKLTLVGQGVAANDSASNTYSAANNYLQSTTDLLGIYATAGGPYGAAQAVAAAKKTDTVKVIGYDIIPENVTAVKDGSMYGVIGQDAFGQGYNVAIDLYNAAVAGKKVSPVLQDADSPFVTKANIADHDPSSQPVGKVGAS